MRLTKEIRSRIVHEAMKLKFGDRENELEEKKAKAADVAYDVLMGEGRRKHVDALPASFFLKSSYVTVALDGKKLRLSFKTKNDGKLSDFSRSLPYECRHGDVAESLSMNSRLVRGRTARLADMIDEIVEEADAIYKAREILRVDLQGMIAAFTTRKSLIKAWPEVEPLLDRILPVVGPGAASSENQKSLAVRAEKLTEALGLPESARAITPGKTAPKVVRRSKKARKPCRAKTTSSPSR